MEESTVVTETVRQTEPETDEDYKWLTERLDAHTTGMAELRNLFQSQMTAILEAHRNQSEQAQTMIRSLSEMVQKQSESLTALAASVTLQLTRPISATTSETNPPEVATTETVVEPASQEVTQAVHAEPAPERVRKFRRL